MSDYSRQPPTATRSAGQLSRTLAPLGGVDRCAHVPRCSEEAAAAAVLQRTKEWWWPPAMLEQQSIDTVLATTMKERHMELTSLLRKLRSLERCLLEERSAIKCALRERDDKICALEDTVRRLRVDNELLLRALALEAPRSGGGGGEAGGGATRRLLLTPCGDRQRPRARVSPTRCSADTRRGVVERQDREHRKGFASGREKCWPSSGDDDDDDDDGGSSDDGGVSRRDRCCGRGGAESPPPPLPPRRRQPNHAECSHRDVLSSSCGESLVNGCSCRNASLAQSACECQDEKYRNWVHCAAALPSPASASSDAAPLRWPDTVAAAAAAARARLLRSRESPVAAVAVAPASYIASQEAAATGGNRRSSCSAATVRRPRDDGSSAVGEPRRGAEAPV